MLRVRVDDAENRGIALLLPIRSYVQSNAMISISAKARQNKMDDLHVCHRASTAQLQVQRERICYKVRFYIALDPLL